MQKIHVNNIVLKFQVEMSLSYQEIKFCFSFRGTFAVAMKGLRSHRSPFPNQTQFSTAGVVQSSLTLDKLPEGSLPRWSLKVPFGNNSEYHFFSQLNAGFCESPSVTAIVYGLHIYVSCAIFGSTFFSNIFGKRPTSQIVRAKVQSGNVKVRDHLQKLHKNTGTVQITCFSPHLAVCCFSQNWVAYSSGIYRFTHEVTWDADVSETLH